MKTTNPTSLNLVFVFADQMRAFSCGYRADGDPVITPNLDRFAAQGMTLTHAVSNFPVCSPFRAMLMSGCYPYANGVPGNCNSQPGRENWQLREDLTCFTDVLNQSGYSVGYIGKWHLEAPYEPYVMPPRGNPPICWNEYTPPHRRHGIGYWHGYNTYDNHFAPEYWIDDAQRDQRTKIDQWSPEHETDVAIDFLRNTGGKFRDQAKPFAMFVSHNPPHTPFGLVPDKYVQQYGDATPAELLTRGNVDLELDHPNMDTAKQHVKNHFAMVTGVDDNFGRLLKEIDDQGMSENTLVVFLSDHGEMMGSHGRMHKGVMFEESLRIPFIARMPGRIAANTQDAVLIGAPDIAPTLLSMLGLGDALPATMQGSSYASVLEGKPCERPSSAFYLNCEGGARGVRTDRYTMCRRHKSAGQREGGPGEWKGSETLLFDNTEDPWQTRNMTEEQPAVLSELRGELQGWLDRTGDEWQWEG